MIFPLETVMFWFCYHERVKSNDEVQKAIHFMKSFCQLPSVIHMNIKKQVIDCRSFYVEISFEMKKK